MRWFAAWLLWVLLALDATASDEPRFKPKACPPAGQALRCGTVSVPEDRGNAGGRRIELNVVVVPAVKTLGGEPPLFHLDGGPGIAATNAANFYLGPGTVYRETRDVVLIDQRGTGGSGPLRCPALEQRHPLEPMYSTDDVRRCLRDLRARADLARYSTEAAAADLEAVRVALGHSAVDLWALSYGTRLAQEYIKAFPGRVRRAVLVGFVPLDYRAPLDHAVNAQRVLDLILAACQRDRECSAKYPDLRGEWKALLQRLDGSAKVPRGSSPALAAGRGPFVEALRTMLTTAAGQREVPFLVHAAAAGDFEPFLARLPKDSSPFAEGLYLTIVCSEGVARISESDARRHTAGTSFGDYRLRQEMAACREWPRYPVSESFFSPPATAPPILVISGEMDQVAAPAWGHEFCAELANCRFLGIPDLGHGPFDLDAWSGGACFDEVAAAFYGQPAALDVSCLKRMRPPPFR